MMVVLHAQLHLATNMPSKTIEIIDPGTIASRPAASAIYAGSIYYATDTNQRYVCVKKGASSYEWMIVGPMRPVTDPLTGSGWTSGTGGGASVAWTAGTKARFSIPPSTTGYAEVVSTSFISSPDSWDVAIRLQVVTGDTSSQTRVVLVAGKDGNNAVQISLWGNGNVELGRVDGGGYSSVGWSSGPDATQRTGGQLWLRLSSVGGIVRAFWGVGSSGNVPTSWTLMYNYADTTAARLTYGTYLKIVPLTINTSISAGYVVDVLDIRAASLNAGNIS
jgi:hypothetical protein